MKAKTNGRIAGAMFLLYTATAVAEMVLLSRAVNGTAVAATLGDISRHAASMRAVVLLSTATIIDAVFLGASLYALTRDTDRDIALLALSCRLVEAVINVIPTLAFAAVLWLVTEGATASVDALTGRSLAVFLLRIPRWSNTVSATCFGVGSILFSYLFLRARSIPALLACLGVVASVLVVVGASLQFVGVTEARWFLWMPILPFELMLAFWLLIKGVSVNGAGGRDLFSNLCR